MGIRDTRPDIGTPKHHPEGGLFEDSSGKLRNNSIETDIVVARRIFFCSMLGPDQKLFWTKKKAKSKCAAEDPKNRSRNFIFFFKMPTGRMNGFFMNGHFWLRSSDRLLLAVVTYNQPPDGRAGARQGVGSSQMAVDSGVMMFGKQSTTRRAVWWAGR